ncbi:histidine kinase [Chloroflexales bacterium ZM16-3]|nr:histidine kinase [Chloroflexales bacterium ZM16-3]
MPTAHPCVYVATLGGQPQIVTLALDRLLAQGEPITEAIIVHLSPAEPRYGRALRRVADEFRGECYAGQRIRFRPLVVSVGPQAASDLRADRAVTSALDTLQTLIRQLKATDAQIHLCISGGRRLLGMLALSAAMLYFDRSDMIWHLSSSDKIRARTAEGSLMHLPDHADAQLVRVPVEPWGHLFPALRTQRDPDFSSAISRRRRDVDAPDQARCQQVYEKLTERQREVLQLLVAGVTVQEISARLCIVISTVHAHKKQIFAESAISWELPFDARADARWLRKKFLAFFDARSKPLA